MSNKNSEVQTEELQPLKFDLRAGFKSFGKDQNLQNVSTGIIGGFVIGLVALPVLLAAGDQGGLTAPQIESWIFSTQVFGALVGIILAFGFRLPIAGAWSIPGAFAITAVLHNFEIKEAVGAYLVAGLLVLLLGITGWITKVLQYIPSEIMDAMVAGVLFGWTTKIISGVEEQPIVALVAVIGYIVVSKVSKRIPPVLGSFIAGIVAIAIIDGLDVSGVRFGVATPMIMTPSFSFQSILSIGIPLALLVIAAENMQAIGVLRSQGYTVPVNTMTIWSGIGGLIAPWTLGHNANIAGLMTAFTATEDAGEKSKRYVAAIWNGIFFGALGLFAPLSLSLLGVLPGYFLDILVALVLVNVVLGSLSGAFGSRRFGMATFFAFMIALSDISILGIGSAFWSVVIGVVLCILMHTDEYTTFVKTPSDLDYM